MTYRTQKNIAIVSKELKNLDNSKKIKVSKNDARNQQRCYNARLGIETSKLLRTNLSFKY